MLTPKQIGLAFDRPSDKAEPPPPPRAGAQGVYWKDGKVYWKSIKPVRSPFGEEKDDQQNSQPSA